MLLHLQVSLNILYSKANIVCLIAQSWPVPVVMGLRKLLILFSLLCSLWCNPPSLCPSLLRFSCNFFGNMTSKGYAGVSWTTARLVPEALESNFHALEDDDMIKWLGRAAFVDTYINGTLGWQDKVRHCVWVFNCVFKTLWVMELVLSHSSSGRSLGHCELSKLRSALYCLHFFAPCIM